MRTIFFFLGMFMAIQTNASDEKDDTIRRQQIDWGERPLYNTPLDTLSIKLEGTLEVMNIPVPCLSTSYLKVKKTYKLIDQIPHSGRNSLVEKFDIYKTIESVEDYNNNPINTNKEKMKGELQKFLRAAKLYTYSD